MLHGLVIDNLSSWYYTLANPVALAADVHLYDLRGHGRTEMPAAGYTVEDNVDDLVALLDHVGHRPSRSTCSATASAAWSSLALAHRHPERVASLFLIEAHFAVEGWGEHMAGSLALAAFGLDEDAVQDWLAENADRKLSRLAKRSEQLPHRDVAHRRPPGRAAHHAGWPRSPARPSPSTAASPTSSTGPASSRPRCPAASSRSSTGSSHSLLTEQSRPGPRAGRCAWIGPARRRLT